MIYFFWVAASLLILNCTHPIRESGPPVAILGAFSDEIEMLNDSIQNRQDDTIGGIRFIRGELSGKKVVIAYTGIGKVNAAMTTTLLLEKYHPSGVIFTGIAGGINPSLKPGDLVVSERCVQHDLNIVYDDSLVSYQPPNPITGKINPVYYYADSLMLEAARNSESNIEFVPVVASQDTLHPRIIFGTIATGDAFIASKKKNNELSSRFHADAVEMEGAAVAQLCYQRGIPFIIIRSISDSADEYAEFDIREFYQAAARNANLVVMKLLKNI